MEIEVGYRAAWGEDTVVMLGHVQYMLPKRTILVGALTWVLDALELVGVAEDDNRRLLPS